MSNFAYGFQWGLGFGISLILLFSALTAFGLAIFFMITSGEVPNEDGYAKPSN